jgi:hypothetical protein
VHSWAEFGAWEGRHEELLQEAERERLAHELREGRKAREADRRGRDRVETAWGIEIRWGLPEDEAKIADLLELNGMPRWLAFEERYVVAEVAERDGEILAALRYRTESKRLLLGLFVSDPWVGERPLAVALYAGAGRLAREMGVGEVLARPFPHATDYLREAGYRRRGRRGWRLDVARSERVGDEPAVGRWRRLFGLFGAPAVPFVGLLRRQG